MVFAIPQSIDESSAPLPIGCNCDNAAFCKWVSIYLIYQNYELKKKSSDNLVKHVQNVHRLYLEFQCMRFTRYEIRNVPHEFLLKILDER